MTEYLVVKVLPARPGGVGGVKDGDLAVLVLQPVEHVVESARANALAELPSLPVVGVEQLVVGILVFLTPVVTQVEHLVEKKKWFR